MNCEKILSIDSENKEPLLNKKIITSYYIDAERTQHVINAIETCQRIYTAEQFKLLFSSSINSLIPHEFAVCGIGQRGKSNIDFTININHNDKKNIPSFTSSTVEKLFQSLIEQTWENDSSYYMTTDNDSIIINNNQWLITMRQFNVSNIIELTVVDKLGKYSSYFCFALCKVDITPAHRLLLKYLIPHLHMALTNIFYHNSGIAVEQTVKLSDREIEVLNLIYLGYTNAYIAEILQLSVNTIKNHVHKILKKMRVSNRTQALTKAMGMGLIDPILQKNITGSSLDTKKE